MNLSKMVVYLFPVALLVAELQATEEDSVGEQGRRPTIYVGMTGKEFSELIREHSCEDITDSVGIRPGYSPKFLEDHDVGFHWILIPGDTCLFVRLSRLKGEEDFKVYSIRKGPDGAGYGGKLKWLNSEVQTIERVELTNKKSEQGGAGQPATAPESKAQGDHKLKPESKGRSQ